MITQVSEFLYRGPRPENMDELESLGIEQIINLEVGWFEWFHGLWKKEQNQANAALIPYVHLPVSDWMFPTDKELTAILTWIKNSTTCAPEHKCRTYIHCLHGQDRTGIVCAAYRVKAQGWKVEDAIGEMLRMGFHTMPYETLGWITRLREYCQ